MKFHFFFIVILVVLDSTFTKRIQKGKEKIENVKSKRKIETSNECKFINPLYGEDESFDCCNEIVDKFDDDLYYYNYNISVVCKNGHIVEL